MSENDATVGVTMRNRILLILFPSLLLLLLASERVSTYLLGVFPSSANLWIVWLELRPIWHPLSVEMDYLTGDSMGMQAVILMVLAASLLFTLSRKKAVAVLFLTNHFALTGTAIATVLTTNASTASIGLTNPSGGLSFLTTDLSITALQIIILALGVLACIYCHYAFISDARDNRAHLAARLTELQFAL